MAGHAADGSRQVDLETIFREELADIARRREWLAAEGRIEGAPPIDVGALEVVAPEEPPYGHNPKILLKGQEAFKLAGLALSGGGIRSAAICLGVLQGLNRLGVLDRFDYLSTVSGGGYIGASYSATSFAEQGKFAFDRQQGLNQDHPEHALDISDTPMVRHLRDYSRYLIPHGFTDLVQDVALVLRGMVTNAVIVFAYLLLVAAATLAYNPTVASLWVFGPALPQWLGIGGAPVGGVAGAVCGLVRWLGWFAWLEMFAAVFAVGLVWWSIYRSHKAVRGKSEFAGKIARIAGVALLLLAAIAFLDLQNWLLAQITIPPHGKAASPHRSGFLDAFKTALFASPVLGLVIGFFRDQLVSYAKDEAKRLTGRLAKYASAIALLVGSMIMPLVLWLLYLGVVYGGLESNQPSGGWGVLRRFDPDVVGPYGPMLTLLVIGLVFWLLTLRFRPNAYSLHRLYRDRLDGAFLVNPENFDRTNMRMRKIVDPHDPHEGTSVKMSALRNKTGVGHTYAPYPIMNTALNVQGSAAVNRRGRNADFFSFTPRHAGSPSTGYVPIEVLEKREPSLDLAAITAISGAAASSNMGANTIRPMSLTLALLNVRLGYWLRNPRMLRSRSKHFLWLWREMTSGLDETLPDVYLTDGGHIENLGIYELLRRRCSLIVAVDAEADPELAFPSFVALQRYARIDLGVRIHLPWEPIAENTRKRMAANAAGTAQEGDLTPQAALGRIFYDDGTEGVLFYIKSSLSGRENDYVRAYALRNPSFPHESTADQFFSEEQFEVYRALGFDAARSSLSGATPIAIGTGSGQWTVAVPDAGGMATPQFRELTEIFGFIPQA